LTRLDKLTKLRQGIDYPNVDSLQHRTAVRDFLVLLIDEEIERERLPVNPSERYALPLGTDFGSENATPSAEPNSNPDVTTAQPPETKP
jgi:hypothetical protein